MRVKSTLVKIVTLTVLVPLGLAACAAPAAPTTSEPAAATSQPPTPAPQEATPTTAGASARPIQIEAAQVQIGEGSPIPVDVVASGTWPDLCAQVALVEQRLSGTRFEIDIQAQPPAADCPPDQLGLPFRMAIPLNMVSLPAGSYTVAVNGVETSFEWSNASAPAQPAADMPAGELRPLSVEGVNVEVGVGSPIPVEVVASGSWPDLCAQLAEVTQTVSAARIEISLKASPADPACPPDPVGIPFRIAVPLNMVEMPLGTYTIAANGVETVFEWTGAPPEAMPVENMGLTFAFIGRDGNLWIADASGGPPRPISSDAAKLGTGGDEVVYYFPKISSDGRYIAARRDAGTPVTSGVQYTFGLQVYNTETGESRAVYNSADVPPAGYDWKPGTHLLAFGTGSTPNYFTARGEKPDPALVTGINAADLDTGETSLLVEAANGYSLIQPVWSPDGRFLSFDELVYMEGKGPFAYYDFEAQEYIHWDEALGDYDWSPDGSQLAYDLMTYTATGEERIFTRARVDGTQVQVSPDPEQGYAFLPVYSPDGKQIAYLLNPGGPDSIQHTLVVQDLASGEVRELGSYESAWYLEWSPDGKALIFSSGPHLSEQVYGYDLASGEARVLVEGSEPTLARP